MSVLASIKASQLTARKNKQKITAEVLTTLLGEASAVGKNNGNREPTDAEVVAVIKKFIKNIDETLAILNVEYVNPDPVEDEKEMAAAKKLMREYFVLRQFLPRQMTGEEIRSAVKDIIANLEKPNMGEVMKQLKSKHEGQFDGGVASVAIKELLA